MSGAFSGACIRLWLASLPGIVVTAWVVGDGLSAADAATLGAGTYAVGDRTWETMEPKQKPKHW